MVRLLPRRHASPWVMETAGCLMLLATAIASFRQDMIWHHNPVTAVIILSGVAIGGWSIVAAGFYRFGARWRRGQLAMRVTPTAVAVLVPGFYWNGIDILTMIQVLALGFFIFAGDRRISRLVPAIPRDWWQSLPDVACVYLIQSGHLCKIGYTIHPIQRIRALQLSSAVPITVRRVWAADDPVALERMFHDQFAQRRVYGEWFNLTVEDLAWCDALPAAIGVRFKDS